MSKFPLFCIWTFSFLFYLVLSAGLCSGIARAQDFSGDCDVDGMDVAQAGIYLVSRNPAMVPESQRVSQLAAGFGTYSCPRQKFVHVYEVGPGKTYETPNDIPWENIQPSTLVLIHYRPEPYACKWVVCVTGTRDEPVVISGVPAENGTLPVITGDEAVTRLALDYWNENRSVIKIGGSSHPSSFPSHITIENLEIRSGRPGYHYRDDHGNSGTYASNAAAIHVEMGRNITIRNCTLTDCGNGFFAGSQAADLLLEYNHIHGNGIEGSIYQHNNYTEVDGIVFQFNHFGPLRHGCLGNNLKDRSAGTVIRYNWIEAGNRTIDLVESDHHELLDDPEYSRSFVYGNILIKHDVQENGQVIHYGGDGGDYSRYRKGTLWFFNNTVVSYRSGNTTLLGISTNDEHVAAFNNVIYATASGTRMAVMGARGVVDLYSNWLPEGWRSTHESYLEGTLYASDNITGTEPGFVDFSSMDFRLDGDNTALMHGAALPVEILPEHNLLNQYGVHQSGRERFHGLNVWFGAFQ